MMVFVMMVIMFMFLFLLVVMMFVNVLGDFIGGDSSDGGFDFTHSVVEVR